MVLTVSGSLADDIVGKLSFLQGRGIKNLADFVASAAASFCTLRVMASFHDVISVDISLSIGSTEVGIFPTLFQGRLNFSLQRYIPFSQLQNKNE